MSRIFSAFIAFISVPLIYSQAQAADCDLGGLMFRDMLYGAAGGAVIGGLIMVADEDDSNVVPKLATSALVGTGVGAMIGIVDFSIRNCNARFHPEQVPSYVNNSRRTWTPYVMIRGKEFTSGMRLSF